MTKAAPAWMQCSITMSVAIPHACRATCGATRNQNMRLVSSTMKYQAFCSNNTSEELLTACTRWLLQSGCCHLTHVWSHRCSGHRELKLTKCISAVEAEAQMHQDSQWVNKLCRVMSNAQIGYWIMGRDRKLNSTYLHLCFSPSPSAEINYNKIA